MSRKITRNTLLSLLLLILVAFAVMPWVIGRNVEEVAIANSLALLPPEIQSQITLRESSFTSGWFRSEGQLELEYQPLGGLPVLVQLDMDVQHGPLLITPDGLAFGLVYADIDPRFDSEEIRAALQELPFALPDLLLDLQVNLLGKLQGDMRIAPISHNDANGRFDFAGIDSRIIAYRNGSAEFSLNLGTLIAEKYSSGFHFNVDGLTMHATSEQINDLLARSAASMSIRAISSSSPYAMEIENLEMESRVQPSAVGAEHTDWYQRVQVGQIQSEDLPLTSISWTSEINETRNDLFRRYYQLLVDIQTEMNASGGIFTTAVTQSAEEFAMLFLQNGMVLNNSLAANLYAGEHSIDLRIRWRGLPDLTELARLDINAVLAALDLTFDLALDLEAVMRSPLAELVDPYVQEGYLQLDNGRILMRAEIRDSELSINGQRQALDDIL